MPAHLMATRSQVAAAHVKNRERIAAQRRPAGEPKNFSVGDAVLLVPQKCGKVGKAVGFDGATGVPPIALSMPWASNAGHVLGGYLQEVKAASFDGENGTMLPSPAML